VSLCITILITASLRAEKMFTAGFNFAAALKARSLRFHGLRPGNVLVIPLLVTVFRTILLSAEWQEHRSAFWAGHFYKRVICPLNVPVVMLSAKPLALMRSIATGETASAS
jgi:hypothetical protein